MKGKDIEAIDSRTMHYNRVCRHPAICNNSPIKYLKRKGKQLQKIVTALEEMNGKMGKIGDVVSEIKKELGRTRSD